MNTYFNSLKRVANSVPNVNVNVNRNLKTATLSYGPGTFVTTTYKPETNSVHINYGRTHKNMRMKGVGTMLRALVTIAAMNTVSKVTQRSVHTKNTKGVTNFPPSYYIMKKLGYRKVSNGPNAYNFEYIPSSNKRTNLKSYINSFT